MQGNRLRDFRVIEGLTITELATIAKVSTKVISQTERGLIDPREVTKRKIVNGLNLIKTSGGKPYAFEAIFPQDPGA